MKKILLSLLVSFVGLAAYSQVSIGNGTSTSCNSPMNAFYGYTYSQSIYLQSEINASGSITSITYDFEGTDLTDSDSVTVYLAHSSKTEFNSTSDWEPHANFTQVFNGNLSVTSGPGPITITFTTPFVYNNVDNLIVAVKEDRSSYAGSSEDFYAFSTVNFRSLSYYDDGTRFDVNSFATADSRQSLVPNTIFGGITQSCPVPSGLTSYGLNFDTANITWVNGANDSVWVLEYGPAGFVQGTGTLLNVNNDTVGLGGLAPTTSYDVYLRGVCHVGDSSSWVGPYTFMTTENCPAPSSINAFYLNSDTVALTWVNGANDSAWVVEYGASGFTQGAGTILSLGNDTIGIGGLTPTTDYDFYVRGVCHVGDSSSWVGPFSFSTPCPSVTAPWVENFENAGSIPSCWSQGVANSKDWEFANTGGFDHIGNNGTISGTTNSGGYFAWLDDSSPHSQGTSLLSPLIDVSGLTTPALSFFLLSNNEGNSNVDFSIDVFDGSSWNVAFYTSNSNTYLGAWEEILLDLSTLTITGDIQLRFVVDENNGTDFYDDIAIDDIKIDEMPSCPKPSGLTVYNVGIDSALVTWTQGFNDSVWVLEYGTTGFVQGTGTTVQANNDTVVLSGLMSDTDYDVYLRGVCHVGDSSVWIGSVSFTTLESCPAPSSLSTFATSQDTTKVTWLNGLYDSVWVIEYGVDGFVPGTGTVLATDTNITDVYGLTPATDYDIYVRSVCTVGDTSVYVGPFSFTTLCPLALSPAYLETFDSYLPNCWSEAAGRLGVTNTNFTSTTSSLWSADDFANNALNGRAARIYNGFTTRDEWLISPSIDLGNGSVQYQLELDYALTNSSATTIDSMGYDDSVAIVISPDNGITWSQANIIHLWDTSSTISNVSQGLVIDLTGYTDTVKFGIYAASSVSNTAYDFHIDNFWVREVPNCVEPSNLALTNIGLDSADIKWTSSVDDSTWIVQYGTEGFTLGTGTTVNLTADSTTLNGLTQNTIYDIYVRSVCKSLDTSIWVGPLTINTLCDIQVAPYVQNFDGMSTSAVGAACYLFDDLTDCWSNDVSNYNNWAVRTGTTASSSTGPSSDNTSGTGNYLYTESSSCFEDTLSMYSPLIDLSTLTLPQLTFYNHMYGSSMGTLTVYVSNDGGLTWNNEWTISGDQGNQWNKVELILPNYINDTVMLKIEGITGTNFYSDMAIDDILLGEAPSCPKVSNIESFNIEFNSADVTWVNGFNDSSWIIEYDSLGFTLGTGNVISGTNDTISLSSLTPDTDYEVYVRSICHIGDSSIWIGPYTFRTLKTCPEVDSIYAFATNYDSTQISWINGFYDSSWIIEWDTAGFTQGTGNMISGTDDTVTLLGLTQTTDYEVYVRSICHIGDSSIWIGPFSFTTPCTPYVAPWIEEFATNTLPACWNEAGDNSWEFGSDQSTPTGFADYGAADAPDYSFGGGGTFIGMDGTDNGNGEVSVLLTPIVDISTLATPALSYAVFSNNTNDAAQNKLIVDLYDGTNWVRVDSIQENFGPNWRERLFDLSAYTITGNVQVRFTITGDNSAGGSTYYNDILLDDIQLYEMPTCPKPFGITAYDAGKDSVNLTWTPGINDVSWIVEYGPKGFALGTGSTHLASDDTTTVSGLSPDVEYEFYVRGFCGAGDSSQWIGPALDTTLPACIRTQSFTVLSSTANSIDVGWNIDPSQTTYIVEYGPTGYTPGMGDTLITAYPNNYLSVTGLSSSTEYDFYVKAVCNSGDTSVWDGPFTGTTACSTVALPWTEGFENVNPVGTGLMPLCMVEDGDWVTSDASATYNRAPRTGTNYVTVNYDADDWIFTPKFDLDTSGVYEFSFWYVTDGLSGWDEVSLHAGTDQASASMTTVIGGELNPSHTTYKEMKGYFKPTTSGVYTFGVYVDGPSFSPWYLSFDDFGVRDTTQFVGIDELNELSQFSVYPNPNNGEFILYNQGASLKTVVTVMDIQGRVVYDENIYFSQNARKQINLTGVNTGMYILQINNEGRTEQHRVVVE